MIDVYPLAWPAGKPRTPPHRVERSRFEPGSRPTEVSNVKAELHRLGARNVIVSTNLRLRGDGLPYARDRAPQDCGIAVYFDYAGGQKCFACDRWATIEENLRAVFKSIEAIRGLERWGSKSFVDAAFTGFAALPAPGAATKRPWRAVFDMPSGWNLSIAEVTARYRELAKERQHDHDQSVELNLAREEANEEVGNG